MKLKRILSHIALAVGCLSLVMLCSSFKSHFSEEPSKVSGKTKKAGKKLPTLIDNSVYDVMNVVFTDTATILTMRVKGNNEIEALIGSPFLKTGDVKEGFQFRHGHIKDSKKTLLTTSQKVKPGEEVVMYFDPLPKNTKEFSYSEWKDFRNKRIQIGIRVDGKKYHGSEFQRPTYPRREHLPSFEAKLDSSYLFADMNMPNIMSSWTSKASPWSEISNGFVPTVDSLSKINVSMIHMLPVHISMEVNGVYLSWLSIPGNKTRVIFDAPRYSEMIADGTDPTEAYYDSFGVYDTPVPEFYTTKRFQKSHWSGVRTDWLSLPFEIYVDSISRKMNDISQEIESLGNLSGSEREFLHIVNERNYVNNRSLYYLFNVGKLTEEEREFFNSDKYRIDPKAANFLSATSPGSIYVFGDDGGGMTNYLKANGLVDAPICRIMDSYNVVLDSIATIRAKVKEDDNLGIRRLPECNPTEILDSIVASYKGKTVFVDYWNTWCGPCMKGMEEMEKYKDDLIKKGVEFVYIADESSPDQAWRKVIKNHKGNHYFILSRVIREMKLSGFEGSIPFYMIFKPDGSLYYTQSGWSGAEDLVKKIEEASSIEN